MNRFLIAMVCAAAMAVHAQHGDYSALQNREIKAPSSEEIQQYRAGAGMGYARAAELELADQLRLSEAQRTATERLMDEHKREALFRQGHADEAALARAVRQAAALGEYRLSHLETHRRMRALLNEEQVKRYDALR